MELIFEEPPQSRGRKPNEADREIVGELKSRPNEWARAYEVENKDPSNAAATLARSIRKGQRVAYRMDESEGAFEATARVKDGKGVVYVRYVPAKKETTD